MIYAAIETSNDIVYKKYCMQKHHYDTHIHYINSLWSVNATSEKQWQTELPALRKRKFKTDHKKFD